MRIVDVVMRTRAVSVEGLIGSDARACPKK